MSCCVLVIRIQKLAIEDLVEIKLYQIQSKIFTILQPTEQLYMQRCVSWGNLCYIAVLQLKWKNHLGEASGL